MSRFLTTTTTTDHATETTLSQIANSINDGIVVSSVTDLPVSISELTITDVDNSGAQTTPLDVNVTTAPVPVTPFGTFNVNVTQFPTTQNVNQTSLNGFNIDTRNGSVADGTQRNVLTDDYESTCKTNIEQIGGTTIADYVGTDEDAIRVSLSRVNDTNISAFQQSTDSFNVNLKRVNNVVVAAGDGAMTTGTQRVCIANDNEVSVSASSALPVQVNGASADFRTYNRLSTSAYRLSRSAFIFLEDSVQATFTASYNLAQDVQLGSPTYVDFVGSGTIYVTTLHLYIRQDGAINFDYFGTTSALSNGISLAYEPVAGDTVHYIKNSQNSNLPGRAIKNYGNLMEYFDEFNYHTDGSSNTIIKCKMNFDPPIFLSDSGSGQIFLSFGVDDYTDSGNITQIRAYVDYFAQSP